MRRNTIWAIAALLAMAISVSGCSCGGNPPNPLGDGGMADGGDGGQVIPPFGTDGGTDGGPGSVCLSTGTSCSASDGGGVCCSGICGTDGTCTAPSYCQGPQATCTKNTECCSNSCLNGACSSVTCADVSQPCTSNGQCCTGVCGSTGTCESVPGQTSCKVRGQACSSAGECCSDNCQGGVCVPAYSCQANGDVCYGNADCCGNACSKNDGTPGICLQISGGGGGGCTQDGNPCISGASTCCSRICLDPGSGADVCQPAGGCRLTGDSCENDSQCCGGGINPNGTATCVIDPTTGSGRCSNGQKCNPEGNICGAQVLPDGGGTNSSQDCCDGKKAVCKLDSSGIPRCFGGGAGDGGTAQCPTGYDGTAGCCIAQGDSCQLSGQCCNGAPCIPNPTDAGFICATGNSCLALGADCMGADGGNGGGCCAGSICAPAGELGFACQLPPPDGGTAGDGGTSDGGTTDGGTTDAGFCNANGTACTTAANCCSGICGQGADAGLQCLTPSACQPQGQTCTATSDCCSGLSCAIDPATSTGTCQQSTCPGAGQTCSPTSPCCSGLMCANANYATCDGTSPCTCTVIIN